MQCALTAAGISLVDGAPFSAGIKGFERMANKLKSRFDHRRKKPWPRPQFNVDVVRCLVTLETVEDALRAIVAVRDGVFGGLFSRFKNGMLWGDEDAAQKHHLRTILATGAFTWTGHETIGQLRADPEAVGIWDAYCNAEPVSESIGDADGTDTWQWHVAGSWKSWTLLWP